MLELPNEMRQALNKQQIIAQQKAHFVEQVFSIYRATVANEKPYTDQGLVDIVLESIRKVQIFRGVFNQMEKGNG